MKDMEGIVIGLEASSEYAGKIKEILCSLDDFCAHRPANRSGLLNLLKEMVTTSRSGAFVLCFQHRSAAAGFCKNAKMWPACFLRKRPAGGGSRAAEKDGSVKSQRQKEVIDL